MPESRQANQRSGPPAPGPTRELGVAHAPYNFVPLPARVAAWSEPPAADRYHADRYSGQIDLTIEALTPLYIRGTLGPAAPGQESKDDAQFFGPTGRPAIPGSSLRGMLRTLVEIAGSAAPQRIADSHFVYRAVAERVSSSLTRVYRQRLEGAQTRAGYLAWRASGLVIEPAQPHSGRQYWRVDLEEVRRRLHLSSVEWQRRRVFFRAPEALPPTGRPDTPLVREFQEATGECPEDMAGGWLVLSGAIQGKKHGWIIAAVDETATIVPVSEDDERAFRAGWSPALEARDKSAFPLLPRGSERLPCFYAHWRDEQQREHLAIGHTRWFRVPYAHGVRGHIPAAAQKEAGAWDLAEAIFGRVGSVEQTWRGRLFVEDAPLSRESGEPDVPAALPRILSSPKPTTFQHYLVQDRALASGQPGDLRHWDDAMAAVRGYKMYWHRPAAAAGWRDPDETRNLEGDTQGTPIRPVGVGARFGGRIRFENLSDQELGALLFVLDLPTQCRHRLGMGKPLGLGSVRIIADLHIDDRTARYRQLFTTTDTSRVDWAEPERRADREEFRRAFARWVVSTSAAASQVIGDDPVSAAWEQPRLQALRGLLTWDSPPPIAKTSYMQLEPVNEFRARHILPDALTVIGWQPPPAGPAPESPRAGFSTPGAERAGSSPRPVPEAGQGGMKERTSVRDVQPGSGPPTVEDLQRRFQRQTPSSGAPPKRESAGDKARREQRELLDRLRREDRPGR